MPFDLGTTFTASEHLGIHLGSGGGAVLVNGELLFPLAWCLIPLTGPFPSPLPSHRIRGFPPSGVTSRVTEKVYVTAIDVDLLVYALDEDRIPRAHILSPHRQKIRCEQAVRRSLVETRAQYAASAREMVRAHGEKVGTCNVESFPDKVADANLSAQTRKLIEPWVKLIKTINVEIVLVEQKLMQLCEQEDAVKLLCTAPGVSSVVAAAFVSVVDEAKRFKKAHELESYLGLVPKEHSSGGKQRLGGISKAGNSYLRSLLVQSAWSVLRQKAEDPLKMWGMAIAQKRGKRIAVVAIARRLAGILWAMWRDGRVYDPTVLAAASTNGLAKAEACAKRRREAMATAGKKFDRRKRQWNRLLAGIAVVSESQP